jgi:hypothetical protein
MKDEASECDEMKTATLLIDLLAVALANTSQGCGRSGSAAFPICGGGLYAILTRVWPVRVGHPPCQRWQTVESFRGIATFSALILTNAERSQLEQADHRRAAGHHP